MSDLVLRVQDLQVSFHSAMGRTLALDGLSLEVAARQIVGVVGESGCGKSTLGMASAALLPPAAQIDHGTVQVAGQDLASLSEKELRGLRGREIGVIFQEPMTALNPVMRVGDQIAEGVRVQESISARAAWSRAVDALERVGLPDPAARARSYPHQLSGGMRQRVVIAMAITGRPKLIVADEPTTALDVTVQAQILDLLRDLGRELDAGVMIITHDLGVIADVADDIAVMYAGRKIESGSTRALFQRPEHPYTVGLLRAIPAAVSGSGREGTRLHEIPGRVPTLDAPINACTFADRCPRVVDACRTGRPDLDPAAHGGLVACIRPHGQE